MQIKEIYNKFKRDIQKRKQEFVEKLNNKQEVYKELCFCLLTPQSKALNCWSAVEEMFSRGFPNVSKRVVLNILKHKVRFYKKKAKFLFDSVEKFDFIWKLIKNKNLSDNVIREILVRELRGMGYKEASHFLRNIGYSFNLAILDRHILNNLKNLGVIKKVPRILSKKIYCEIEDKFRNFSKKISIPMIDLDLLFWAKQTGFVFK